MKKMCHFEFLNEITPDSKVLVINPLNTYWTYQLTTEAAFSANEISRQVYWMNLAAKDNKNQLINSNDHISLIKYKNPLKRISKVMNSVGINTYNKFIKPDYKNNLPKFKTIKELKEYTENELPVGALIFSAIASARKSTAIQLEEEYHDLNYFYNCLISMYSKLENEVCRQKPNLLVTCNDRLLASSLAILIGSKYSIPVRIVYWGSDPGKCIDYKFSLFDSSEWQKRVNMKWQDNPPSQEELLSLAKFAANLIDNPTSDSKTFTANQLKGSGLGHLGKFIVFYAQSEHEHSPVYALRISDRFENQYIAFQALQEICKLKDYKLVLKLHPSRFDTNESNYNQREQHEWAEIVDYEITTVIGKDSNLDTYQIIKESALNAVWNSTVGVESIIRNCPTLVLGNAHWLNTSWNIHAWNRAQLESFLSSEVVTLSSQHLLPWFYYVTNFGEDVKYSKINNGLEIIGFRVLKERVLYVIARTLFNFLKYIFQQV